MQSGLSLFVLAKSWMRDSHGLFDYESDHVAKSLFELKCAGHLVRDEHKVQFLPLRPGSHQPEALLAVQKQVGDRYTVAQCTEEDSLWTVVRYLPGPKKGLELTTDSILKLGRVVFRIKEIGEGMDTERSGLGEAEESVEIEEATGEEIVCRICYERQSSRENPLLSPCKCDGTVKYLHLNCLKMWIKSKVTTRQTDNSVTYQWKTIECDLCKLELPLTVRTKTDQVVLFQYDRPSVPYIVLEAVPTEREAAKALHVIMMTQGKQTIRLGRGHDSDVRINDISVSRCHAMIRFETGRFSVEDNDSKFGTLVKTAKQLDLREGGSLTVQAGRSLLMVQVKRSTSKAVDGNFRQLPIDEFAA